MLFIDFVKREHHFWCSLLRTLTVDLSRILFNFLTGDFAGCLCGDPRPILGHVIFFGFPVPFCGAILVYYVDTPSLLPGEKMEERHAQ